MSDIHTKKAVELFGTQYKAVTKEQREIAKKINFTDMYGFHGKLSDCCQPIVEAKK